MGGEGAGGWVPQPESSSGNALPYSIHPAPPCPYPLFPAGELHAFHPAAQQLRSLHITLHPLRPLQTLQTLHPPPLSLQESFTPSTLRCSSCAASLPLSVKLQRPGRRSGSRGWLHT